MKKKKRNTQYKRENREKIVRFLYIVYFTRAFHRVDESAVLAQPRLYNI